jgi:hypothetical protein
MRINKNIHIWYIGWRPQYNYWWREICLLPYLHTRYFPADWMGSAIRKAWFRWFMFSWILEIKY